MAKRRRRRPAAKKRPLKTRPTLRPSTRRRPSPAVQRSGPPPLPPRISESSSAAVEWALLDPLDVNYSGFNQRGETLVLKPPPSPTTSKVMLGRPLKAAPAYAAAAAVKPELGVKPADLFRGLGIEPSRLVWRRLATGRKLVAGQRQHRSFRQIRPVLDAIAVYRYKRDKLALLAALSPYLAQLPGVKLDAQQIYDRLAPRILAAPPPHAT